MKEKEKKKNKTFKIGERVYKGLKQLEILIWIRDKKIYIKTNYVDNIGIP